MELPCSFHVTSKSLIKRTGFQKILEALLLYFHANYFFFYSKEFLPYLQSLISKLNYLNITIIKTIYFPHFSQSGWVTSLLLTCVFCFVSFPSRQKLTVCPVIDGEDHLRLLNFQHNFITRIQNISNLQHLVFLDLYDNQIEEISGLSTLRSLRVLLLGKNR